MPAGRPSLYTAELASEICERIASGVGLQEICRAEEMPHRTTVLRWLEAHEEFRTQYARARDLQADRFAEEILEIADDGSNDWMERRRKDGEVETVLDREHVQRSQLRVDARKWLMARMAPKKYGDKATVAHTGPDGGAIRTKSTIDLSALSDDQLVDALRLAEAATRGAAGSGSDPEGAE